MTDPFRSPGFLDGGWRGLVFAPFRDGIEIASLLVGEPAIAVLRYQPGAGVPWHRHPAPETILVLDGTQTDQSGTLGAGALAINPAGSAHSVWSETGCAVLIQWAEPVEFLAGPQPE